MATEDYSDIIHLPYSGKKRGGLSMYQRAAQFAPFAALTGHGAAINETARLTDSKIELSEHERSELDRKLALLLEQLDQHPKTTITHFVPDEHKMGGSYREYTGHIRKWNDYEQILTFDDRTSIMLSNIIDIEISTSVCQPRAYISL